MFSWYPSSLPKRKLISQFDKASSLMTCLSQKGKQNRQAFWPRTAQSLTLYISRTVWSRLPPRTSWGYFINWSFRVCFTAVLSSSSVLSFFLISSKFWKAFILLLQSGLWISEVLIIIKRYIIWVTSFIHIFNFVLLFANHQKSI